MNLKKIFVGFVLLALPVQQNLASVTIQFEFEAFRDSSGSPLTSETYAVFIADTNKDSAFPSASDLFGSGLEVGDDINSGRVFFSGVVGANSILSGTASAISGNDLGLNSDDEISGTKWAVYWFPGLSAAPGPGGLQDGQSYGFYHSDQIDPYAQSDFGASASMVMPGDGSTVSVIYVDNETNTNTSFPSPQDFTASFTVIPEPNSVILVLVGSAVLLRRRRI